MCRRQQPGLSMSKRRRRRGRRHRRFSVPGEVRGVGFSVQRLWRAGMPSAAQFSSPLPVVPCALRGQCPDANRGVQPSTPASGPGTRPRCGAGAECQAFQGVAGGGGGGTAHKQTEPGPQRQRPRQTGRGPAGCGGSGAALANSSAAGTEGRTSSQGEAHGAWSPHSIRSMIAAAIFAFKAESHV